MSVLHIDGTMAVRFDKSLVIVHQFVPIMPQWPENGSWQEVGRFTNEKDWDESPYSKRIQSSYILDMIMWHWIDMSAPSPL